MELFKISWEGDSKEIVSAFPSEVKQDIGFALLQLQRGEIPSDIRPMTSIGAGVFEIKTSDERAWYRAIYLSKVDDTIYVLHCFEKQSRKTERRDLETARTRLSRVRERMLQMRKDEKRKG